MAVYETKFNLTNPVNDFDAAQEYLSEDDMTSYLTDSIDYDKNKCDAFGLYSTDIVSIEWILTTDHSGKIKLVTKNDLSPSALKYISDWVSGQNSDGLGEGFEQQSFAEIYDEDDYGDPDPDTYDMASFDWQTNNYEFKKVSESKNNDFMTKIIEDGTIKGIRNLIESKLQESDLSKFSCKDYQKVPYGQYKSNVPCSIKPVSNDTLTFVFWNTNKDDVDDILNKWAKDNNVKVKEITNKKELPVNGGNVWLYVDLVGEN